MLWVTQQAGGRAGPYSSLGGGPPRLPHPPNPCFLSSLPLSPSSQEGLAVAEAQRCPGNCFTYLLIGSQRERRARSSSARKESNLAFMAVVIGLILQGSFYLLLTQPSGGWGADWLLGPGGPVGSLGTPGSGRGSEFGGVGVREWEKAVWTGWPRQAVRVFQEPSDPADKGCLRSWL